jgi:hypothetical protein
MLEAELRTAALACRAAKVSVAAHWEWCGCGVRRKQPWFGTLGEQRFGGKNTRSSNTCTGAPRQYAVGPFGIVDPSQVDPLQKAKIWDRKETFGISFLTPVFCHTPSVGWSYGFPSFHITSTLGWLRTFSFCHLKFYCSAFARLGKHKPGNVKW